MRSGTSFANTLPMANRTASPEGKFPSLWSKVANAWIAEAPRDDALCEFDCRRPSCGLAEWLTCERRLRDVREADEMDAAREAQHRPRAS